MWLFSSLQTIEGATKRKQTGSSTKWRSGGNVVLRLMECLTPTVSFDLFMNNYFTFFRLLTTKTWILSTEWIRMWQSKGLAYE